MSSSSKERAARTIVAALLASDMPLTALREIALTLLNEPYFSRDLGLLLESLTKEVRNVSRAKGSSHIDVPAGDRQPIVAEALSEIKRRRLAKRDVVAIIDGISPGWKISHSMDSATLADILESYRSEMPLEKVNQLLTILRSNPSVPDEYLQGIMKRT